MGAAEQVSKPSSHKDNGTYGRRLCRRIAWAGVRIARLAGVVADDLANGPQDGNVLAWRANTEISAISAAISYTEWAREAGDMEEAMRASLPLEPQDATNGVNAP